MLDELSIGGVKTNINFFRRIIGHPAFAAAEIDTGFIPRNQAQLIPQATELDDEFWQAGAQAFAQNLPSVQRADGRAHRGPTAMAYVADYRRRLRRT